MERCLLQVLLQSDLIKSSSEERSLLKNLGSWLGKFTIGRNQTLRAKEIDPKILIIEVMVLLYSASFMFLHCFNVVLCWTLIICTFDCLLLHQPWTTMLPNDTGCSSILIWPFAKFEYWMWWCVMLLVGFIGWMI